MTQERMQVLELVAAGTLTPEQAAELLSALDESRKPPPSPPQTLGSLNGQGGRPSQRRAALSGDWHEPSFEQLIHMKKYGISPQFLKEAREIGLGDLRFEQIVQLAKYGVTAQYAQSLRDALGDEVSFEQLVALAKYGVRPTLLQEVRDAGLGHLDTGTLITFAKYGVSASFIQELGEVGMTDLTPARLVQLAKYGISPTFIQEAREAGFTFDSASDSTLHSAEHDDDRSTQQEDVEDRFDMQLSLLEEEAERLEEEEARRQEGHE